jgi:hypothetical protein
MSIIQIPLPSFVDSELLPWGPFWLVVNLNSYFFSRVDDWPNKTSFHFKLADLSGHPLGRLFWLDAAECRGPVVLRFVHSPFLELPATRNKQQINFHMATPVNNTIQRDPGFAHAPEQHPATHVQDHRPTRNNKRNQPATTRKRARPAKRVRVVALLAFHPPALVRPQFVTLTMRPPPLGHAATNVETNERVNAGYMLQNGWQTVNLVERIASDRASFDNFDTIIFYVQSPLFHFPFTRRLFPFWSRDART